MLYSPGIQTRVALFKRNKKEDLDIYSPASGGEKKKPSKQESADLYVPEKGTEGAQPLEVPAPPPPPEPAPSAQERPAPEVQTMQEQVAAAAPEQQQPGVRAATQQDDQVAAPTLKIQKTPQQERVEKTLSEGLTELYQAMTPAEQKRFRDKGEQAAKEITSLVTQFKATAKKVVSIIRDWLSSVPGVNKFFLEQESKLKTDQILKLQRKMKEEDRIKRIHR